MRLFDTGFLLERLGSDGHSFRWPWLSGDAYYNVGGETRINETYQGNAANTVRLGAGSGLRVWRGGEFVLNYEEIVARPSGQPISRTYRLKFLQLW
jgi:hypothetical protein